MLVGVCQVELIVPESNSLKSKRLVLNSLKARIRNKFNVSVSEIDHNDKWQRISLGISMICNERRFIDQTVNEILRFVEVDGRVEILQHLLEIY